MKLKILGYLLAYWLVLKLNISPIYLYILIWILYMVPDFKMNLNLVSFFLIIFSLLAYVSGIDYSGEIFFCILLLTIPNNKISEKNINFSWIIIAVIGVLEFIGIIPSELIQVSDSTYDYFRIQTLLGNPYMTGVFTFFVLVKNISLKNWNFVFLNLGFLALLGNRVVMLVSILYFIIASFNKLKSSYYFTSIGILSVLIFVANLNTEIVTWQEYEKPLSRIFSFTTQISDGNATIFLTDGFAQSVDFSIVALNNLDPYHWIRIFSISDVMLTYVAYAYGILFVIFYIYYCFMIITIKKKNLLPYLFVFCFIALSISDPGMFHPLLIFLFLTVL